MPCVSYHRTQLCVGGVAEGCNTGLQRSISRIKHELHRNAVLTFRGWHVCARCHRNKKNLHATLRSGSELASLPDRILLLIACRPRARVIRACAVGVARRGAQIGRLGAPCKAGGRWCSLPHGCRRHRAPQFRAIGSPVGRAALRLETGRATCRSRTAQDANAPRYFLTRMGRASRPGRLDGATV